MTSTASDHVEESAHCHATADNPADPLIKLRKGKWCAENVEERLDPEGVHEGTVLMDIANSQNDAEEEQSEEDVVALNNPSIKSEIAVIDWEKWEEDWECAESDRCKEEDRS